LPRDLQATGFFKGLECNMRIANILIPEAILTDLSSFNAGEAVAQMVTVLAKIRAVDVEAALKDIAARERTGSTIVPIGSRFVAIPHAYTNACKQLLVVVGLSREGIPWDVAGAKRVSVVIVILAPHQTQTLYLRVLGRIAGLCQIEGLFEEMLQCTSGRELISKVAQAEESLGDIPEAEGKPTFCVVGAGHGGMAMAGHLALMGWRVNFLNRTAERILPVQMRGGIEVTGEIDGFASLNLVTCDAAQAIMNADIVMVVVPATAHRDIVKMIAPHLKDGQIVVLNPGRTGGALEASRVIKETNPEVKPYVAEAQTLLYTSRVTNPGQVRIFSIKNSVPLATLPAHQVVDVLPLVRLALPQFVAGDNVLKTGLDNIGAVFHPTITVLNAGRIEDTHGDFDYYVEGVTPSVASVLEAVDQERVNVASALGIRANTAREWLYLAYNAAGRTLLEAMRANRGYSGIRAPETIQHRYISEDVPASLVPIASIGEMLHVPTPTIRSIINLASIMHGIDYWKEGRTVDSLGIKGMSVKDIQFFVVGAEVPPQTIPSPPGPDLL
jgi:opine dehydrogenase